jgi:hypothetical protein
MPLRIIIVNDLVHLPEIEVIGAEPLERFFELLHPHLFVTPMRADFCHEKNLG